MYRFQMKWSLNQYFSSVQTLGLPRVLVAQLLLSQRYFHVLADEASRTVRARALRAP